LVNFCYLEKEKIPVYLRNLEKPHRNHRTRLEKKFLKYVQIQRYCHSKFLLYGR